MPHGHHARFHCPRCGSPRARRSASRNLEERLIRALTLFRPYRCRDCGHRGWRWRGVTATWRQRRAAAEVPGRQVEKRDLEYLRRRRLRRLTALVTVIGLGATAGVFLQKCGQPGELHVLGK